MASTDSISMRINGLLDGEAPDLRNLALMIEAEIEGLGADTLIEVLKFKENFNQVSCSSDSTISNLSFPRHSSRDSADIGSDIVLPGQNDFDELANGCDAAFDLETPISYTSFPPSSTKNENEAYGNVSAIPNIHVKRMDGKVAMNEDIVDPLLLGGLQLAANDADADYQSEADIQSGEESFYGQYDTIFHRIVSRPELISVASGIICKLSADSLHSLIRIQGKDNMTVMHLAIENNATALLDEILGHLSAEQIRSLALAEYQVGGFTEDPTEITADDKQDDQDVSDDSSKSLSIDRLLTKVKQELSTRDLTRRLIRTTEPCGKEDDEKYEIIHSLFETATPKQTFNALKWKDHFGNPAFHAVLEYEVDGAAEFLLGKLTSTQAYQLMSSQNWNGDTPIFVAMECMETDTMTALTNHLTADQVFQLMLHQTPSGEMPLNRGLSNGDVKIIEASLQKLSNDQVFHLLKPQVGDQMSVIQICIEAERLDLANVLLEKLASDQLFQLLAVEMEWWDQRDSCRRSGNLPHLVIRLEMKDSLAFLWSRLDSHHICDLLKVQEWPTNMTLLHIAVLNRLDESFNQLIQKLFDHHILNLIHLHTQVGGLKGKQTEPTHCLADDKVNRSELIKQLKSKIAQDLSHGDIAKDLHTFLEITKLDDSNRVKHVQSKLEPLGPEKRAEVLNWQDESGKNLLHKAVQLNLPLTFTAVADHLTNELYMDMFGVVACDYSTCLHWAVQHGWVDVVFQTSERFALAGRDFKRIANVKNEQKQYTLGFFNSSMSAQMRKILLPFTKVHLTSAGDDKNLLKACLIFDNSSQCRIRPRYEYDKEAWWRVGMNARIVVQWKQEQLRSEIRAAVHNDSNTISALIVGIVAEGRKGMVLDCEKKVVNIEQIVRDMEELSAGLPKVLIVEIIPEDSSKPSTAELRCNIRSLNFSLITYMPSAHTRASASFFTTLTDILMSIRGGEGISLDQLIMAATRSVMEHEGREAALFESTLCKSIILHNPNITHSVMYTPDGQLIHGGKGYPLQLKDSTDQIFYLEIQGDVRSLCKHEGAIYCLTKIELDIDDVQCELHIVDLTTHNVKHSVITFMTNGLFIHEVHVTMEFVIIAGPQGLNLYSHEYDLLKTCKALSDIGHVKQLSDGRFIVSNAGGFLYCYSSLGDTMELDWTVDLGDCICYGLAFCPTRQVVYSVIQDVHSSYNQTRTEIYVFNIHGEKQTTYPLPECGKTPESVYDISVCKNNIAVAHGLHGFHIYHLVKESTDPTAETLIHWSNFSSTV